MTDGQSSVVRAHRRSPTPRRSRAFLAGAVVLALILLALPSVRALAENGTVLSSGIRLAQAAREAARPTRPPPESEAPLVRQAQDVLTDAQRTYREEVVPRLKAGGGFDRPTFVGQSDEGRQRDSTPGGGLSVPSGQSFMSGLWDALARARQAYEGEIVPRLSGGVPSTAVTTLEQRRAEERARRQADLQNEDTREAERERAQERARLERARLERERRLEAQRQEVARRRAEAERRAREREEARLRAERLARAERDERERRTEIERQARLEREALARERAANDERARLASERARREREARDAADRERAERAERLQLEAARRARERRERERLELQRLERERLLAERQRAISERQRAEAERRRAVAEAELRRQREQAAAPPLPIRRQDPAPREVQTAQRLAPRPTASELQRWARLRRETREAASESLRLLDRARREQTTRRSAATGVFSEVRSRQATVDRVRRVVRATRGDERSAALRQVRVAEARLEAARGVLTRARQNVEAYSQVVSSLAAETAQANAETRNAGQAFGALTGGRQTLEARNRDDLNLRRARDRAIMARDRARQALAQAPRPPVTGIPNVELAQETPTAEEPVALPTRAPRRDVARDTRERLETTRIPPVARLPAARPVVGDERTLARTGTRDERVVASRPDGRRGSLKDGNQEGETGRTPRAANRNPLIRRVAARRQARQRRMARYSARCRNAGRRVQLGRKYTVARGDSLWRIARTHYGRGIRYRLILRANRSQIRNRHLIYPCQRFRVPRR